MFRLSLFRIRAFFWPATPLSFLGSVGRGGLQFMLMIWFQGIWLPQHGYSFVRTPLWAGIYMIPFMIGFVVAGTSAGSAIGPLRRAPLRDGRHARFRPLYCT